MQGGAARKRALYVTNRGVHAPLDTDPVEDIRSLRVAIKDLRESRP